MNRSLALALAASFALVALGVASPRSPARQAATAASGAQAGAPVHGGDGRSPSAQDWSLRYRVAAQHQLELGDDASRTRLGIGLEAECTLVPLMRSAGTTEAQGRCQGVALDLSGSAAQAFSDSARSLLEQQLETSFFFTLRPDGGVARVAIDPALDPLVAGLVRDLIAGFIALLPVFFGLLYFSQRVLGPLPRLRCFEEMYDATQGADVLCLMTEWRPFRRPDFRRLAGQLAGKAIFDGRNQYDDARCREFGLEVYPVGVPTGLDRKA